MLSNQRIGREFMNSSVTAEMNNKQASSANKVVTAIEELSSIVEKITNLCESSGR